MQKKNLLCCPCPLQWGGGKCGGRPRAHANFKAHTKILTAVEDHVFKQKFKSKYA